MDFKESKNKSACIGLVFVLHVSCYLSRYSSIETRKSLRLLKRKSCKGCADCTWLLDFIRDDIAEMGTDYLNGLMENKRYKVRYISGYDSYTGEYDPEVVFDVLNE